MHKHNNCFDGRLGEIFLHSLSLTHDPLPYRLFLLCLMYRPRGSYFLVSWVHSFSPLPQRYAEQIMYTLCIGKVFSPKILSLPFVCTLLLYLYQWDYVSSESQRDSPCGSCHHQLCVCKRSPRSFDCLVRI